MFCKMLVLLMVVVLFGTLAGNVLAQDVWPPVFCGDLDEADCALLEQAQTSMMALSSAAFVMEMDMALSISEPDFEGFAVAFGIEGAAGADPETLKPFMAFDPAKMGEMLEQMPDAFIEMLRGIDADIVMEVAIPAELLMEAGMPEGIPPIEMLMTEGVLYVNVGALMPAEAAESMQMPPWMGIDIGAMYEGLFAMMSDEAMTGEMPDMAEIQEMLGNEAIWGLYDPELYEDFVIITRGADEALDGQAMAVFYMTLDYEGMFTSEVFQAAFADYMTFIMEMQGESMDEMDMPENFMDIMAAMMSGMDLEMEQWIGLEDGYIHAFAMDMVFDMDFAAMAELMPDEDMSDAPEEFSMTMSMAMEMGDFNVPVEVVHTLILTVPPKIPLKKPLLFAPCSIIFTCK
ncbi:hypothetical protein ACFLYO_09290 [Chloroflexota bacterium]